MHGMQPDRCIPDPRCHTLGVIFPALNADDDEFLRVPCFELPQLREYMDAVNSTVGPEIQKNDLSSQIRERKTTPSGVNPVQIRRKLRAADCRHVDLAGHFLNR
jgi:hypothetical protein